MLLDDVVAGIEAAGIPCRRTVFNNPPQTGAFAVWGDAVRSGGADTAALTRKHYSSVLLAENQGPDGDAVDRVDAVLDSLIGGMSDGWSRREREWSNDERVYVTEYTFSFTERLKTR